MPMKMITCPHCGATNSERKQECFECHQALTATAPVIETQSDKITPVSLPLNTEKMAARLKTTQDAVSTKTKSVEFRTQVAVAVFGATLKQRIQLYRQMHSLLKAGIPMGLALNYLEGAIAFHLRPMAKTMAQSVQGGSLLSEAMTRFAGIFPEWEVSMIMAAEKSGNLPEAMEDLAETLEVEMDLRYQVGVKLFPLKATAVVFVLVLMLITALGSSPGGITSMSALMALLVQVGYRFIMLCAAAICLWQAWKFWGRSRTGARVVFETTARTPLIGPIIRNQMRYRFAEVLGALWRAGVAPMESLATAARASGNHHLMQRVTKQLKRFGEGATISDIIEDLKVFPAEAIYLIRSGETGGSIGESLQKVAEYIRMELNAQVKTLPMRAQLAMYALLVPAVAYLVIKVYLGYAGMLMDLMNF